MGAAPRSLTGAALDHRAQQMRDYTQYVYELGVDKMQADLRALGADIEAGKRQVDAEMAADRVRWQRWEAAEGLAEGLEESKKRRHCEPGYEPWTWKKRVRVQKN